MKSSEDPGSSLSPSRGESCPRRITHHPTSGQLENVISGLNHFQFLLTHPHPHPHPAAFRGGQLGGGGSSLVAAQLRRQQRGGSTAAAVAVAARRQRRQLGGSAAAAAAAGSFAAAWQRGQQ
jgi:hypothetical protein